MGLHQPLLNMGTGDSIRHLHRTDSAGAGRKALLQVHPANPCQPQSQLQTQPKVCRILAGSYKGQGYSKGSPVLKVPLAQWPPAPCNTEVVPRNTALGCC